MARALAELRLDGLTTTTPFLQAVMREPLFRAGEVYTDYIERVTTAAATMGAADMAVPQDAAV